MKKLFHCTVSILLLAAIADAALTRPNVVVILTDDLGYADTGYQGSPDMVTPHVDSIARSGVRFTAGYVTAPVCAPSRAGYLSGIYQNRYGFEYSRPNENFLTQAGKTFLLRSAEMSLSRTYVN
jgi:opacity protein-like surface antigen